MNTEIARMLLMAGHADRFHVLHEVRDRINSDIQYWKYFRDAWTSCELLSPHDDLIREMVDRPQKNAVMTLAERNELRGMADPLTVYRGCRLGLNDMGWSWTLDRGQAEWFARRWADGTIGVYEAKVRKVDVIGLIQARDEREIIVDPELVENAHLIAELGTFKMSDQDRMGFLVRTGLF